MVEVVRSTEAEIESYQARKPASQVAKAAAKTAVAATRKGAVRGVRAGCTRLGRGLHSLPSEVVRYLVDVDGLAAIEEAPPGDATTKARVLHAQVRRERRSNAAALLLMVAAWWTAGWTTIAGWGAAGWMPVAGVYLTLTGVAGLTSMAAWGGKTREGWTWPVRLWTVLAVSAGAAVLHHAAGAGVWWMRLGLLAVTAAWVMWAAADGSIADNLGSMTGPNTQVQEPQDEVITEGSLAAAVTESIPGLSITDPKKCAYVPAPGIITASNGQSYGFIVDTRGAVPAGALANEKAKATLAAKLRVGVSQVFPVEHEDNAARATVTVVTGRPFAEPVMSPLVTLDRVDLWNPPSFFRTVDGRDLPLPIFGNNIGIGGMPDFGKSTTLNALILTFLLGKGSVRVIDGGEVDTEPFHRAGLLGAWCRDATDAIDLLSDFVKDIETVQSELGQMGKRKVDPEFFAETGRTFELLAWDELEAYTNHPDSTVRNEIRRLAGDVISRCRKTGKVLAWATQSPSAGGVDANFRDKTIIRIGHYCSTPEMSNKILGARHASRGIDASALPKDVPGVCWYSGRTENVIARPHRVTETEVDQIIDRLRRQKMTGGEVPQVPAVIGAMAAILQDARALTMGSTELLDQLRRDERFTDLDYSALADMCRPHGVRPVKVGGVKVYRRADVERALSWAS